MAHPCGNLPVSGLSIALWYCHHHQAWWGHVDEYLQDDGDPEYESLSSIEFGPFDSPEDVYLWASRRLEERLTLPGRPWGSWRLSVQAGDAE